jgi:hypothetical protein
LARTTEKAVKAVLLDHYDATSGLQAFVDTASALVDDIAAKDATVAASRLALIECYLAAHFYAHADMIAAGRSTGAASGQFQGQTGMGFDATLYGQTAKRLDPTGVLVNLDQPLRPKASMSWLGKVPDDALDVDERDY